MTGWVLYTFAIISASSLLFVKAAVSKDPSVGDLLKPINQLENKSFSYFILLPSANY